MLLLQKRGMPSSSKECNAQGADALILHNTPEASAEHCIWPWAALLNCREPKIALRNEVVLKKKKLKNQSPDP